MCIRHALVAPDDRHRAEIRSPRLVSARARHSFVVARPFDRRRHRRGTARNHPATAGRACSTRSRARLRAGRPVSRHGPSPHRPLPRAHRPVRRRPRHPSGRRRRRVRHRGPRSSRRRRPLRRRHFHLHRRRHRRQPHRHRSHHPHAGAATRTAGHPHHPCSDTAILRSPRDTRPRPRIRRAPPRRATKHRANWLGGPAGAVEGIATRTTSLDLMWDRGRVAALARVPSEPAPALALDRSSTRRPRACMTLMCSISGGPSARRCRLIAPAARPVNVARRHRPPPPRRSPRLPLPGARATVRA